MIIIYTKIGCPWCEEVLDFLRGHKVAFEERNVTSNPAFFQELVKKSGQNKAPTLDIDGHIMADTDAEQVAKYLGIGLAAKDDVQAGGVCPIE